MICYTAQLGHPNQTLTVEWDRAADWDKHWLLVFNGASGCRQVVRHLDSYTAARKAIQAHLDRRAERVTA